MKYSLFIGRWQCIPPHEGHIALIESELKKGNPVCIAIRNTKKDEKNPFTATERIVALSEAFDKWGDMVRIIVIPDIRAICYGRKVGYDIERIKLADDLESISATEIRKRNKTKELW